jgi:peptidoglycan/LPS O-acetylase OafA/YrhL
MEYRREIDGLRAFAVLPVILFHAGFQTFSGGFVGVDVFFVISGYLITTIILGELEQDTFSIANFYERRARRILPALFLVMLTCIPFAWLWLLPGDMREFSESLVAVSLFGSNILFWRSTGYFDTANELKPLLHTWSLAVEEQFYFLFPIFLMLSWRFARRWIMAALVIVFVASLAAAQWGAHAEPAASFFLLPTRGWELLIGVFAALYLSKTPRPELRKGARELGGWLGVALILFSVFAYDKDVPFPGLYALVPTVGALLIILCATQETAAGRFVGNKAFVGVGLISYSAYLWHQPLFAFARHRSLTNPGPLWFAGLSVLSLVLAYLSWRFVEAPFRKKEALARSRLFLFASIVSATFILIGLSGHFTDGVYLGRPQINQAIQLDSRLVPNRGLGAECGGHINDLRSCTTYDNPEVLVWGDSYAMHLIQGFVASNPSIKLVQKTLSSCGPILDVAPISTRYVRAWSERCMRVNDKVFDYLRSNSSVKYVVMSSPFSPYVNKGATVLTKEGEVMPGYEASYAAIVSTIKRINALGKTPVVFSPTPQNGENIGRCLAKAALFEADNSVCDVRLADSDTRQAEVHDFLKKVERLTPVVWLSEGLCSAHSCKASFDNIFVYRDDEHLSSEGSFHLGKQMGFYNRLESLRYRR